MSRRAMPTQSKTSLATRLPNLPRGLSPFQGLQAKRFSAPMNFPSPSRRTAPDVVGLSTTREKLSLRSRPRFKLDGMEAWKEPVKAASEEKGEREGSVEGDGTGSLDSSDDEDEDMFFSDIFPRSPPPDEEAEYRDRHE